MQSAKGHIYLEIVLFNHFKTSYLNNTVYLIPKRGSQDIYDFVAPEIFSYWSLKDVLLVGCTGRNVTGDQAGEVHGLQPLRHYGLPHHQPVYYLINFVG